MAEPVKFTPRPYVADRYEPGNTGTLLDLMRLASQARAESSGRKAEIRSQGIQNIGHLISQALGSIRQEGQQREALALKKQEFDRDEKFRRDQMAEAKAAREAQTQWQRDQFRVGTADAAADVMAPGQAIDPATYKQRFAGTPSDVRFQHQDARPELLPSRSMTDYGVPGYATTDTDSQPFDVMQGPSMSRDTAARPERFVRTPTFQETQAIDTSDRQRQAAALAAANTAADNKRADEAARATESYRASRLKIEQGNAARAAAKAASESNDKTDLTPEGLDAAALNYAKTGTLPPLGMGDKTTRKQIINRAAAMMPGLDIASAKADFTANQGSLNALQKQRDALGAFEETALKNLNVFLELAKKVPDTGSPWLNKPLRDINEKALGGDTLTAYNTARRTVIPEFAKILANPGLSGQLSDTARKEIEEVISGNATLKQTMAAARVLKQDTENRRVSYDDQIAGIRERLRKGGTTTPPPAAEEWVRDAKGNLVKKGGG